ncbi:hypothetical protein HNV10_01840 [Winogradskyella litoriviva]|uniref:Uncharacterized protein n=1 Tax=Winogradskyella litoriviva TaxID=1220182 RepID=A0ABX2E2E2_9FLAO|nr:hypothetical protein [Winogradskyella litoriviva]NRD21964.1 hypothetical protein [Winogradskyella litoriviva]
MSEKFETILLEHETLNKLITEKDLNTFVKFPSFDTFSTEFIDWLSPKYYEVFVEIYNTHLGTKKEAKVVRLINSTWFCNAETTNRIVEFLSERLDATVELSKQLNKKIKGNKNLEDIINVSAAMVNNVLNYINKAIFEKNHPAIIEKKNEILDNSLAVCEELKQYKASSEVEFTMFNGILDRLKSIKLNDVQSARYQACLSKSKSSSNKYLVVTVILVVLFIIRMIVRFVN